MVGGEGCLLTHLFASGDVIVTYDIEPGELLYSIQGGVAEFFPSSLAFSMRGAA